jgi:shikimate dehydrogenase
LRRPPPDDEGGARERDYAVIGDPVAHSLSPVIQQGWLDDHGIAARYDRVRLVGADPVLDLDELSRRFAGLNVTLPHKEAALACAREASDAARAIGAANTLVPFAGGGWRAENTDAPGFLAALMAEAGDLLPQTGGRAVVAGAGGSARAIVWALANHGFADVAVVNRTVARARTMVGGLGVGRVLDGVDPAREALGDADLFVNTTSVGMGGDGGVIIGVDALPASAVVADIVYVPLETPLLAAARARGLVGVDGLGMLVHQAALAFELWHGVRPDPAIGRARALEALALRARAPC